MPATSVREKVFERLVAWIWEQQALSGPLPADDGHEYQVVFRGRPWGERNPDFQGAILAREDGLLLRGDVEIHVRASDWRRHRHGRDPAYNQAVCQVVLWQDEPRPIVRQDGTAIPTIELVTRLAAPLAELERRAALDLAGGKAAQRRAPAIPCVETPSDLAILLDRAGVARLLEHAATFESDLACLPPEEVLYRGALRAMGYTANTHGFEQLGQALPLATLRAVTAGPSGPIRVRRLQAALLGVAGLLPSQRGIAVPEGWPDLLEAAWAARADALPSPLPPGTWRAWRVRPENVPVRRAAGVSHLIGAWSAGDPLDRLLGDLATAEHASNPTLLATRWQARAEDDGFWANAAMSTL